MVSYTNSSEYGGVEFREYVYEGEDFGVSIDTSNDRVTVSLDCDLHYHRDLMLEIDLNEATGWEILKNQTIDWYGVIDEPIEESEYTNIWTVIREGTRNLDGDTSSEEEFDKAVELCSSILLDECKACAQVDEFFGVIYLVTPERRLDASMLIATEEDDDMALDKRVYEYEGNRFAVVRTSPDSATVDLKCGEHTHEDFIVGTIEGEKGWLIGRKESADGPRGPIDKFATAIEWSCHMLVEECDVVVQLDEFFAEDERLYEYRGEKFEVIRISRDSATVNLKCGKHDHESFNVALGDGVTGWLVGRDKDPYGPTDKETGWRFEEAVEFGANILVEECGAVVQLDEFFAEGLPTMKERLDTLAAFLPEFEAPGFEFGRMETPPGKMPYYTLSPLASCFVKTCYAKGWIKPFEWAEWKDSPEATLLRDDPSALEKATIEQLSRLLTVITRQDRFVEGALGSAFESGLLSGILHRAAVLATEAQDAEPETSSVSE